jgi:transcriptional antiterminator NusG
MSQQQRRAGFAVMQPQEAALFPRYVFTRFDIQTPSWRRPSIMPASAASCAIPACRSGCRPLRSSGSRKMVGNPITSSDSMRSLFKVGDDVVVTNGPFASFPGVVEEALDIPIEKLSASMRIKVAVNIFGRATPVELEYWQVAKAGI